MNYQQAPLSRTTASSRGSARAEWAKSIWPRTQNSTGKWQSNFCTKISKDADKLGRFIQEAKAASALNHPNILTVYEIGEVDGKNYIATELIDGQTLREHLSHKESLQLNAILKIGVQVSEALSAAHQAGIIHRDIKPENIMLRKDGYAKVLDFGLAKV